MTHNPNRYRYLIGFVSPNNGVVRCANVDITLTQPITSGTQVELVQGRLRQQLLEPNLVVLAFSLYAEPGMSEAHGKAGGGLQ
jgi:hypothetical protein